MYMLLAGCLQRDIQKLHYAEPVTSKFYNDEATSTATTTPIDGIQSAPTAVSLRFGIHRVCKAFVDETNHGLGKLEAGYKILQTNGSRLTSYQETAFGNNDFSPYYYYDAVGGASLGVGGMTALRRGKRSAAVILGGLAGGLVYFALQKEKKVSNMHANSSSNGGDKKKLE